MIEFLNWFSERDRDTKVAIYFLTLVFLVAVSIVSALGIDRYSRYKIKELDVRIMEIQSGGK